MCDTVNETLKFNLTQVNIEETVALLETISYVRKLNVSLVLHRFVYFPSLLCTRETEQ